MTLPMTLFHPKTVLRAALPVLALSIALPASALATAPTLIQLDEDESRAKALEIIDRHVEAIGGEDALRANTSVTQTGTLSIPAAGLAGEFRAYNRAPNHFTIDITLPSLGSLKTGFDGEIGWSENPIEGATLFEGRQLHEMKIQADYISVLNTEKYYKDITFEGVETFTGQQANAVKLVGDDGTETTQFFSVDSGLLIGTRATQASTMGDIEIISELSEYKEFGDVKFATKTLQKAGPQVFEILIMDVKFDKIGDEMFALPPAIQALTEAPEPAAVP